MTAPLADVDAGRIDVVVVYKIDRLTRSLPDFARIVEKFDAHEVSFVSVTQSFNTTSSMGRLTLNVLLSFAQFEREVTGERIRDKIAASKAKGLWMGGRTPLGYDLPAPGSRILRINEDEAQTVRHIFTRYLELGSVHILMRDLADQGIRTKVWTTKDSKTHGGIPFNRGGLYHLLRNPIYLGRIRHKGVIHEGGHVAIIDQELFDRAQVLLDQQAPKRRTRSAAPRMSSPLVGKIFDASGEIMSPSFTNGRHGKSYRYYVSAPLQQGAKPANDGVLRRISANDIERVLAELIKRWLPPCKAPLDLVRAVHLRSNELLIDLPATFSKALASTLHKDEEVIHMTDRSLRVRVPFQLPIRGGRRQIITTSSKTAKPDPALIAALRKAHGMLELKQGMPVMETSPVSPYDRKILRLAFLAPRLQQDILSGKQPASITLETLRWMEIPLDWKRQREALGWPSSN